jgi:hypothetical protein
VSDALSPGPLKTKDSWALRIPLDHL